MIQHWENRVQDSQMKEGVGDNLKRALREMDGHKEYGRRMEGRHTMIEKCKNGRTG